MNAPNPATVQTPAPGVYRNVPFATYLAWQAVNKSTLEWLVTDCPAVCRYRMDNPEDETPAMLLGRAVHTLTLEGEEAYGKSFITAGQCAATVKSSGDRCTNGGSLLSGEGDWYCKTRGHFPRDLSPVAVTRSVLTLDQELQARGMDNAVWNNPDTCGFVNALDCTNELSLLWVDPETHLLCKARVDMLRPSWNAIGDLKTCISAHPDRFAKVIHERGYARQGAFYLRGAKELGLPVEHFALLPVEKEPPHVAALYVLDDESREIGAEEIGAAMRQFATCKESGQWPGYPKPVGGFATVGLPAWARRKAERSRA